MAYVDFITKLIDVIDSLYPSKKIRIKGNTNPWIDSEGLSIVNKRDACYKIPLNPLILLGLYSAHQNFFHKPSN